MSFLGDIRDAKRRFAVYIDELGDLLREYKVTGTGWYDNLRRANHDPAFVRRRNAIWQRLLEREGGKLTFGTVLAIIGAVLGGVGIAGAWGAFGLPLVLLLAPAGIWIGNELDTEGVTQDWVRKIGGWFGLKNQPIASPERTSKRDAGTPSGMSSSDAKALERWQEKHFHSSAPTD